MVTVPPRDATSALTRTRTQTDGRMIRARGQPCLCLSLSSFWRGCAAVSERPSASVGADESSLDGPYRNPVNVSALSLPPSLHPATESPILSFPPSSMGIRPYHSHATQTGRKLWSISLPLCVLQSKFYWVFKYSQSLPPRIYLQELPIVHKRDILRIKGEFEIGRKNGFTFLDCAAAVPVHRP